MIVIERLMLATTLVMQSVTNPITILSCRSIKQYRQTYCLVTNCLEHNYIGSCMKVNVCRAIIEH